ncbi:hypothetical protein CLOLEP_02063 [[Clostridium] leptum DSM 753]|uniref:Uncharacterized protein n=1 Tax=[Clostridium] leptum DSM 753 TaxID=428125 RepID=A7VU18_9FIRM|nr:hypothetical protein CLOLEP_02063 [[Clostridium] leptum DSM 753]
MVPNKNKNTAGALNLKQRLGGIKTMLFSDCKPSF